MRFGNTESLLALRKNYPTKGVLDKIGSSEFRKNWQWGLMVD